MSIICWFYLIVLVCSGCSYKNNINWVAYKWQTFISHHSEGWELQDHATSRFSVWWDPSFWFTDFIVFVLCPRMAEGARDLSEAFFIRAQIPSRQDPKATPFWELGFQHKFWGGQKHLDYSTHKILMPQMDGQVDGARCRPWRPGATDIQGPSGESDVYTFTSEGYRLNGGSLLGPPPWDRTCVDQVRVTGLGSWEPQHIFHLTIATVPEYEIHLFSLGCFY